MSQLKLKIAAVSSQKQFDSISQTFFTPADYKVYFTQDIFSINNSILKNEICTNSKKMNSVICFVDSEVLSHHPQLPDKIKNYIEQDSAMHLVTPPISVQGGEACKNDPELLQKFYKIILDFGVDRHSSILAIGGGAVLDIIGYVAATAHRGIRLLRLPTTVLAQNDSGVGVKNGINFLDRKNFLGTFAPPDAVICDFNFLSSLSERDKRAGMAEAIKVSLIRDSAFFDWHETNLNALNNFEFEPVAYSIKLSAQIHARQISSGGDPFEKGSARPLDYGHWLAHKLEVMSGYEVKHGEAVAIGMLVDARYSYEIGLLSEHSFNRIKHLIAGLKFQLWHPALDNKDVSNDLVVLEGIEEFREHLGGELSITLLKEIGTGVEVHKIDLDIMRSSLIWLKGLEGEEIR